MPFLGLGYFFPAALTSASTNSHLPVFPHLFLFGYSANYPDHPQLTFSHLFQLPSLPCPAPPGTRFLAGLPHFSSLNLPHISTCALSLPARAPYTRCVSLPPSSCKASERDSSFQILLPYSQRLLPMHALQFTLKVFLENWPVRL